MTVRAAADDADATPGTATFAHEASSTDPRYGSALVIDAVVATERDDDVPGVTTVLTVPEGSTATCAG